MFGGKEECHKEYGTIEVKRAWDEISRIKHETERMIQFSADQICKFRVLHSALKDHLETINEMILNKEE